LHKNSNQLEDHKLEGRFKGWATGKNFGFIRVEGESRDTFLLKSDVLGDRELTADSIVEFEIIETEKGRQGKNVNVISYAEEKNNLKEIFGKRSGTIKFYSEKRNFGFIEIDGSRKSDDLFFNPRSFLSYGINHNSDGDRVEFITVADENGRETAKSVEFMGYKNTGNRFSDDIQFINRSHFTDLSNLAEKESWNFKIPDSNFEMPILSSYIKYTYVRLTESENGTSVSDDGLFMAFNTGLVTPNQESIFAMCNKSINEKFRPWTFVDWYKESNKLFVQKFGNNPPPLAEYFSDPSDLLFDRRLKFYINIDHILENIERFPKSLQDNNFLARQLLTSAQVQTEKRVYRNYKTAIPQYFRDRGGAGKIQLLLPICLQNPSVADLALTVEKDEEGRAYLASTVLTLDMAYCNARLLARPDTEWLQP
jgi:cold shock CspA family protein